MRGSIINYRELDTGASRALPLPSGKLFVGGLSHSTSDKSLRAFFEKFGDIASAEVLRDHQTLNSRGFGFVTFFDRQTAQKVYQISCSRAFVLDGKQVEVKQAVPKDSTNNYSDKERMRSWHGKLQHYRTASVSTTSTSSPESQHSVGHGFRRSTVFQSTFPSYADYSSYGANLTPKSSDGAPVQGKMIPRLQRGYSVPSMVGQQTANDQVMRRKIFVGGLLYSTGHDALNKYFDQFGEVECAEVIYNRDTKKSRGFGFVIFRKEDSVEAALYKQTTDRLLIDGKQIEIKRCKPRENQPPAVDVNLPRRETHYESLLFNEADFEDSLFLDDIVDRSLSGMFSTPTSDFSTPTYGRRMRKDSLNWTASAVESKVDPLQYSNFREDFDLMGSIYKRG